MGRSCKGLDEHDLCPQYEMSPEPEMDSATSNTVLLLGLSAVLVWIFYNQNISEYHQKYFRTFSRCWRLSSSCSSDAAESRIDCFLVSLASSLSVSCSKNKERESCLEVKITNLFFRKSSDSWRDFRSASYLASSSTPANWTPPSSPSSSAWVRVLFHISCL